MVLERGRCHRPYLWITLVFPTPASPRKSIFTTGVDFSEAMETSVPEVRGLLRVRAVKAPTPPEDWRSWKAGLNIETAIKNSRCV